MCVDFKKSSRKQQLKGCKSEQIISKDAHQRGDRVWGLSPAYLERIGKYLGLLIKTHKGPHFSSKD